MKVVVTKEELYPFFELKKPGTIDEETYEIGEDFYIEYNVIRGRLEELSDELKQITGYYS